jgi:hypothetical protein
MLRLVGLDSMVEYANLGSFRTCYGQNGTNWAIELLRPL